MFTVLATFDACSHSLHVHLPCMSTFLASPLLRVHLPCIFTFHAFSPSLHVHLLGIFTFLACSPSLLLPCLHPQLTSKNMFQLACRARRHRRHGAWRMSHNSMLFYWPLSRPCSHTHLPCTFASLHLHLPCFCQRLQLPHISTLMPLQSRTSTTSKTSTHLRATCSS